MASSPDEDKASRAERTEILPPGRLLDGKYRLGRLLGEGGMGAVYEAEHTGLGTKVALKLLNESFASDPRAISRFRREARAAAAIHHDNIVSVYDTGTAEEGIPFLVMELLEGESLSSFLRREHIVPPTLAATITAQMLSGLSAAHARGVIHRDLKPGNVLLARTAAGTRVVKILDFGISKFHSEGLTAELTATGAVVGTPRFMSPEQARGQGDIDARADLYAAGVLLYRMLTGKLPFTGSNHQEIIAAILAGNPTPPRDINPIISAELNRIVVKALTTNRDQRYQTADAFLEDLVRATPDLSQGRPIEIATIDSSPAGDSLSPRFSHPSLPALVAADPSAITPDISPRGRSSTATVTHTRSWAPAAALTVVVIVALLVGWFLRRPQKELRKVAPGMIAGERYNGPPFMLGITRFLPREQLIERHHPLMEYLADRLERPVELKIFDDYIDLASKLRSRELDLAALTAYAYVRAMRQSGGIELLATHTTAGGTSYEGYIITRADSGIERLQDLKGRVFCYPYLGSTSGYLYPRALFRRLGMDPDTSFRATRFMGDHEAALQALYSGACDGTAVYANIVFEADRHGIPPQRIRILASTDRIPYDAYCTGSSQPAATKQRLRDALLRLKPNSELAKRTLGADSQILGFVPAKDSDYDPVRKIERFVEQSEVSAPPQQAHSPQ